MFKEQYLQQLLKSLYEQDEVNLYDHAAAVLTIQSIEFASTKLWSDQIVKEKLAVYTDKEHTILQLTNFGRYWILNGGYSAFLKENESIKDHHKEEHKNGDDTKIKALHKEKEDLLEARLKLTHYRLVGFWLTIVLSSVGFLLSLFNLYLIMTDRK